MTNFIHKNAKNDPTKIEFVKSEPIEEFVPDQIRNQNNNPLSLKLDYKEVADLLYKNKIYKKRAYKKRVYKKT